VRFALLHEHSILKYSLLGTLGDGFCVEDFANNLGQGHTSRSDQLPFVGRHQYGIGEFMSVCATNSCNFDL
jgi:hypothetical protein